MLVVDDHVFYREGVKTLLATRPDEVTVVGEAATGEEALRLAASARPDVVLMDLNMPGVGGLTATERLVAAHPDTLCSCSPCLTTTPCCPRSGPVPAAIFSRTPESTTSSGRSPPCTGARPSCPGRRQTACSAGSRQAPVASSRPFPELTDREHDLLREILRGRNSQEIASVLGLTSKTVRNYVSNILAKLHARDRAELVMRARDANYPDA